jgi:UDP-N-acetylmuramyl tripeptide synthase
MTWLSQRSGASVAPVRLTVAKWVGTAVGAASRMSGRGQGIVLAGRTINALAPDALAQLSAGRSTVLVSGTNGKTTTTAMIVASLGGAVATNNSGANMPAGIVEAYARSTCSLAVMEVDELYAPVVGMSTLPTVFVALNLSRDHMDRVHEVGLIAQRWSGFLDDRETHVIANAADPNIVAAVGAHSATWVDPGWGVRDDSLVCPHCTALLDWDSSGWSCSCGIRQPVADYVVDGEVVRTSMGTSLQLDLALPGAVNRGNAAFAIAVAQHLGVESEVASRRIAAVDEVAGRYGIITVGGREARTLLAKNPAGWASVLPMLDTEAVIIISINAREADGFDTSWLWEVPFEELGGRAVGVHGEQRADLALRLEVAGVMPVIEKDINLLARKLPEGPCVVLANYTAFTALRGRL